MEAEKSLNKIKKLKPTKEDVKVKVNGKNDKIYKMVISMYEKDYGLKIDKKN